MQLSSSTLEGNFDYAPHLVENTLYQHITKAEEYDSYSAPQWIGYQQKPSYYVEYLVGNGISDMQGEIPHDTSGIGCSVTSEGFFLSMEAHQVDPHMCIFIMLDYHIMNLFLCNSYNIMSYVNRLDNQGVNMKKYWKTISEIHNIKYAIRSLKKPSSLRYIMSHTDIYPSICILFMIITYLH